MKDIGIKNVSEWPYLWVPRRQSHRRSGL